MTVGPPDGSDDFVLTVWTSDARFASRADGAGVQRIGVDLERLGKRERQRGLTTWISPHTLEDLAVLRPVLRRARLFARVNPLHGESAREVEDVLAAGVEVLMLPMVATVAQAATFARLVAGRARVVLLVECRDAIECLSELAVVDGVDEVHLGLNDLALSLGLANRWLVLAGELPRRAAEIVAGAGRRFCMGGIGLAGDDSLPVPSDLVYAEYARTGATGAMLARSFTANAAADFAEDVARARERLAFWRTREDGALADMHARLDERARTLGAW